VLISKHESHHSPGSTNTPTLVFASLFGGLLKVGGEEENEGKGGAKSLKEIHGLNPPASRGGRRGVNQ